MSGEELGYFSNKQNLNINLHIFIGLMVKEGGWESEHVYMCVCVCVETTS